MKKSYILLTCGLTLALGLGVGAAFLKTSEAKQAAATETEKIVIEIGNNCNWNVKAGDDYCQLAVYFYTDNVGNTWGDLLPMDGSLFYEYEYTANSYSNMIVVRMAPGATSGGWTSDVYNQTKDKAKASQITIWNQDSGEGHDGKYWADVNNRDLTPATLTDDLSGQSLSHPGRESAGSNVFQLEDYSISVSAGDKFQISYKGVEYASLEDGVDSNLFDTTTNPGYITAKATGNYDFFFKVDTKKLWVQENSEDAALEFSQTFIADMAGKCTDENANNKAAVEAVWGTHKAAFEALTVGAKNRFGDSTLADIVQARKLYLHCVSKYGLATWNGAPSASNAINAIRTNSNGIIAIAVISAVAFGSLATVFIFLKKKKHN